MDTEVIDPTSNACTEHMSCRRMRHFIVSAVLAMLSIGSPSNSQAQDEECDEFMILDLRIPPTMSVTIAENKGFRLEFFAQLIGQGSSPAPAWLFILRQNGTTGKAEEVDRWKEVLLGEVLLRDLIEIPLNKRKQGFHLLSIRSQCESGYAATIKLFDIKYSEQPNDQPNESDQT